MKGGKKTTLMAPRSVLYLIGELFFSLIIVVALSGTQTLIARNRSDMQIAVSVPAWGTDVCLRTSVLSVLVVCR